MASFFPSGINCNDIFSPQDLLREAQEEWVENTNDRLKLDLTSSTSGEGLQLTVVRAVHVPSRRSANLFTVGHRLGTPYPVFIVPEDDSLPNMLRKTYFEPGLPGFGGVGAAAVAAFIGKTEGRVVKNDWVADTPSEFRLMLTKVFNLGYMKGVVFNLMSGGNSSSSDEQASGESPSP